MSNPNNVDWLIAQVAAGRVMLGDNHRYAVFRTGQPPVDCDAQAYWLEDDGLATLLPGKKVRLTAKGETRHAAAGGTKAAPAVVFKAAA